MIKRPVHDGTPKARGSNDISSDLLHDLKQAEEYAALCEPRTF